MYLEIYFILFIFVVYVYPNNCKDNNNNLDENQFLFQLHKAKLPKQDSRLRRLFPNMTKIYGNTTDLNYYFINMHVGRPPIKQSLIVDTGSQLTAIPCGSKCINCGSHSNIFYELKNESQILQCDSFYCKTNPIGKCSNDNKCMFYNKYAEESTLEGFFFEEYVNFGLDENVGKGGNVILGCTTKESNYFFEQSANGIMGLGNSDMSFTSMLYQRKIIPDNLFSLCLSYSEGYFTLGRYFNWTNREELKNISLLDHQNKYGANLSFIVVNYTGNLISINKDIHTIIDSGSTLSLLPKDIFDQFNKLFIKNCNNETICNNYYISDELGVCLRFIHKRRYDSFRALIAMPNISFIFDNQSIYDLTSEEYYYTQNFTENRTIDICTGFGTWNKNMILLGSNFMHEHNIMFNKRTNTISFARSNCWDVAYYYRRDSQFFSSSEQRYNNRSAVIVRNKTNVTLIINGDDDDLYFELSSEQQMMIAIGSALVFVIVLILIMHFCCGGSKGEDEDMKNNETTHLRIIELASQSTDTEEEDKKEKEVENKTNKKNVGMLRVRKNFEKLII